MSELVWRDAAFSDRRSIRLFRRTDHQPHRLVEGGISTLVTVRPWEYLVQEIIRDHRVPKKRWIERLGFDGPTLATVAFAHELEPGALYELSVAAVAASHRGRRAGDTSGRLVSDMMMADIFAAIRSRAVGPVEVIGLIHHDNHASKKMKRSQRHDLRAR